MNKPKVAYFCMEYGLENNFKIYSGGLGILAGDILKTAKDLKLPMVGIGILWRQGYDMQLIDEAERIVDCFPEYRYDFLEDTGLTVTVKIRKRPVRAKIWLCNCFENVELYLLDTFLPENNDPFITGQLYGWFGEERIAQEMMLGIGGIKALKLLGIEPDIYHFNDSHPVFAGFELLRHEMRLGKNFGKALEAVRPKIVFTTHTPVEAGNEVHSYRLLNYMGADEGFTKEQLKYLGGKPFNMTVAGLHLAHIANGVSALHTQTARHMWKDVKKSAPIIGITNGVHNGTWQDSALREAYENSGDLWSAHIACKVDLLTAIREMLGIQLDPEVLTVGFARRAAAYKRGDLFFSDMQRVAPLLQAQKVQFLFSGKAHPNDMEGKAIIRKLLALSKEFPQSIVYLQDYDMELGGLLTKGCDIWLNTPIRPQEASGTSGMKAAMNGVLNFSVLDGWWPEGCEHGVNGWQIGDGYEGMGQEESDLDSLYRVFFGEIMPLYYENRDKWVDMMRKSIEMSTTRFSAARMLEEYYAKLYTGPSKSFAQALTS